MSARPAPPRRPAVRVTLAQLTVSADREANLVAALDALALADRASSDLLVLPEYASSYHHLGVGVDQAEPLTGPFVSRIAEEAAARGVAVLVGTLLPGTKDPTLAANAVVAITAEGEVAGVYRKVHLYDAFGQRESDRLEAGPVDAPPLVLPVAGLRFGVLTCYDLRFPESARRCVDAGANVLVVPAAWVEGPNKAEHWRVLAIARAIENTAAVVAVGQAGRGLVGRSLVVGPDGVVGLEMDDKPGVRTVDLDAERLGAVRETNPSLANRRYSVVPRQAR
jgi:predicted amidohydrolase